MFAVLIVLFVLCLWKLRFTGSNAAYLSLEGTNAIKGIFAIIILCSHMGGYMSFTDAWADRSYLRIIWFIGQLMVAPFLFYSGYGLFHSFKNKPGYVSGFFKKRFLKILVHFDLAVALFILVQVLLAIYYPARNYVLCWVAWDSVGNSNWFVFVILALYLFVWLGLALDKGRGYVLIGVVTLLSVLLWWLLYRVAHKSYWWVDTIAAFPLGMLFCALRERLERWLSGRWSGLKWAGVFVLLLALFFVWHKRFGVDVVGICSCLFCLLLVWVTMKVKVGNPALSFLGRNAFTIYILQRLPMLVFTHFGLNTRPALFIPLSIVTALLLAEGFTRLYRRIDAKLFHG